MAPIHVASTPIEIAAAPEKVRDVMLDFPNITTWHKGHFNSITVPSNKAGKDLVPGDKLKVSLASGMNFSPAILENTPLCLKWRGSLPGVFTGDHVFEFHPSESPENVGGTKFVQYEDFSGMLSFTMKTEKESGRKNLAGFNQLNEDLKKKCEESKA